VISCLEYIVVFSLSVSISRQPKPVSVAQLANALSELQCATGPDLLETYGGLDSSPGRGVCLLVSWTNSGHAIRLIS